MRNLILQMTKIVRGVNCSLTSLPEENSQGQGDPLDDDPRHEAVEVGLHQAGPHLLHLESEDQPMSQVEDEHEDGDLASGLGKELLRRQHLRLGSMCCVIKVFNK